MTESKKGERLFLNVKLISPEKFFSLTFTEIHDISLILLYNDLTLPGFPDKWSS